jgi:hypothetical protein
MIMNIIKTTVVAMITLDDQEQYRRQELSHEHYKIRRLPHGHELIKDNCNRNDRSG